MAELIALRPDCSPTPEWAVSEAMRYWDAAENVAQAGEQLRHLHAGIFALKEDAWNLLLAQYVGDPSSLKNWLNGVGNSSPSFDVQTQVLPKLFVAKNETSESRKTNLGELLEFMRARGWDTQLSNRGELTLVFDEESKDCRRRPLLAPLSLESLLLRKLNVNQTRLLVTARQKFISFRKSRQKKPTTEHVLPAHKQRSKKGR